VEGVFPDVAPRLREDDQLRRPRPVSAAPRGWADAGVIIPYTIWRVYGDRRISSATWRDGAWVDWIDRHNPDGLRLNQLANNYGDWLCIPSDTSPSARTRR
jgi:alpha-L-rhamnosidase